MTNESTDDDRNAELVPLHPDREHDAPDAPEVLPAVRGDAGDVSSGVEPAAPGAGGSGVPVYADLTRVPGERRPVIARRSGLGVIDKGALRQKKYQAQCNVNQGCDGNESQEGARHGESAATRLPVAFYASP